MAAVTVEVFGAALKLVLAPVRGLVQGVQSFFEELKPFGENINLAYELEQGFQAVMNGVDFATKAITGFSALLAIWPYQPSAMLLALPMALGKALSAFLTTLEQQYGPPLKTFTPTFHAPSSSSLSRQAKASKRSRAFWVKLFLA